jgi:hypothetical protein
VGLDGAPTKREGQGSDPAFERATAPSGFDHPRASTLAEDVVPIGAGSTLAGFDLPEAGFSRVVVEGVRRDRRRKKRRVELGIAVATLVVAVVGFLAFRSSDPTAHQTSPTDSAALPSHPLASARASRPRSEDRTRRRAAIRAKRLAARRRPSRRARRRAASHQSQSTPAPTAPAPSPEAVPSESPPAPDAEPESSAEAPSEAAPFPSTSPPESQAAQQFGFEH